MNPFIGTRKLTAAKEDHLTEFFSAALHAEAEFGDRFAKLTLGPHALKRGWALPKIVSVETQVDTDTNCRPDMRIKLADGHIILCENKLDAEETMGSNEDPRLQLERYLDLKGIDGLLYIRSSWKSLDSQVLRHPKYIRPAKADHFLWRDFYPLLNESPGDICRWLKEGFEHLGFTPPLPYVGDLEDSDQTIREKNRRNFAKLWNATRSTAQALGWKVGAGCIVELYFSGNPRSKAEQVFISPIKAERFLLRITPQKGFNQEELCQALKSAASNFGTPPEISKACVKREEGIVDVIDVKSTLRDILGKQTKGADAGEMEGRLNEFIAPFLEQLRI